MEILKNIFLYGGALVGWGVLAITIYAVILDYKYKSNDTLTKHFEKEFIKTNEKKDNNK